MEGHLSEHPLAELVREISIKRLSGRLRLQQNRVTIVVYFKLGELIYAASNVGVLRLHNYLVKEQIASEEVLARFDTKRSDIALAKQLASEGIINETQATQLQLRQVTDVLRLALLWIDGKWVFDSHSHLGEDLRFKLDCETLLLDAGRRIPQEFAASRLPNAAEIISPSPTLPQRNDLQPTEVSLLSRLDVSTSISDLLVLSGLPEAETLRLIYALALSGLIQREHWKPAFGSDGQPAAETVAVAASQSGKRPPPHTETEAESLERFIDRVDNASTHYEVLGVESDATPAAIKKAYYEFARRFHPDKFRIHSDAAQNLRIDSAFARVTQAYDTLRDPGLKATYDSKLDAQRRARAMAEGQKPSSATASTPLGERGAKSDSQSQRPSNLLLTDQDRAEASFVEGLTAKQRGQLNTAVGLFSSAARLVPNDPRYRAHYGQALASHASTRRLAEAELQAAIKLEPGNADYRVMLAELYRDLGFAVRARSEVEKVLKIFPTHRKARELLRSL